MRRLRRGRQRPAPAPAPSGSTTTDPDDPRLGHGADTAPRDQNEAYLVLSDAERALGFVRPVRRSYQHARPGPVGATRPTSEDEQPGADPYGNRYVLFEEYSEDRAPVAGRYWTQEQLDAVGRCGTITTMSTAIAETYAREPGFYGSTYCVGCKMHLPVGEHGEFVWVENGEPTTIRVGT